jgi:hypothetical protein
MRLIGRKYDLFLSFVASTRKKVIYNYINTGLHHSHLFLSTFPFTFYCLNKTLFSHSYFKVVLFLFAGHFFLANYLRFMVKLIDKAIVINVKIHKIKNERKGFYSSNKK